MPRSKAALLLAVVALCLAAFMSPTTLAVAAKGGKPLVTAITKDPATSLYTSPLKDSRPLVFDLSGSLIWSTCGRSHPTLPCHHHECAHAHSYHPPGCPRTGYGVADEEDRFRCKCTAHPHNPFAGRSATGDLTFTTLSANATDGRKPLYPLSFPAVASCAPASLLAKLPAGAAGVAGLARSKVALPAQVARTQKVADKFVLCLPRTGSGVAIFGGGPLFLMTSTIPPVELADDLTSALTNTPLLSKRGSPAYYLPVKAVAVDKAQVQLPGDPLAIATGGVVLSTRMPYTALRPDVYRPVVGAFDKALTRQSNSKRVAAVAPFELCYDSKTLPGPTRIGWLVPEIVLVLEGGKNWTFTGLSSMVDVNNFTAACFGFVEMTKPEKGGYGGAPAVEIGGFQMENHVLQFDLEKQQLGFAKLQIFTSCTSTTLRPEMAQPPKPALLLAVALCGLSALLPRCTAAGYGGNGGSGSGRPLVTAITKDAATKLYTAPLKDSRPLVLDLSGPLIWSTCEPKHPSFECHHHVCAHAHSYHPPGCPRTGHGVADEEDPFRCKCTAHPYNPIARKAGSGDLTRVTVTANDTDGRNPLHPVSFSAVASCAPQSLLTKLPAGAVGVAGLARSKVALPAQVARAQKVAYKFALCLPSGGQGVAIFGGGPFFLLPPGSPDVTARLAGETPLHRNPALPGYFISAKGIAVNQEQVQQGPLVIGLSSRIPYTELRADVYGPFVKEFDKATAGRKRVTPAVPPFELCYDSRELGSTRLGYAVPQVDLTLESGATWMVFGANSMVQVNDNTACFGFVKMAKEEEGAPAMVIGGFQMENNLLVFDEEKQQLGFSSLLFDHDPRCYSWLSFVLAISLVCIVASLAPCTQAIGGGKPLVTPITKDASTSLYTSPLKDSRPLLLDLSGPLVWSTCDASHSTLELYERQCMEANQYTSPGCWTFAGSDGGSYGARGKCAAHPYNPVARRCASGDLTRTTLSANATDGRNPLYLVSFPAVASCPPESLLDKLPAGAVGVAGLARSDLALPAQVATTQSVARKFALCLPSGGQGVAIFGGGPLYLLPPWILEITSMLEFTPLRRYQELPGYYIWVKSLNVNQVPVVPLGDYEGQGQLQLVVGFSTTIPYTALRRDVYRPFVEAFDNASTSVFGIPRVAPVAPFEKCYNRSALSSFRGGYVVPQIDLILEDGTRYGVFGANSVVQVNDGTVCLAFLEMKPEELGYEHGQAPAMVMGGYQMENNLLHHTLTSGMSLRCTSLLLLSLLLVSPRWTLAADHQLPPKPILTPIFKDPTTSLYTIPIKDGGAPLVLDLACPLLWSTCAPAHRTVPCNSSVCRVASRNPPAGCAYTSGGGQHSFSTGRHCSCTAYPYNPATGQCGHGDVSAVPLSANATDGKNPLFPVSFSAFGSCSPVALLASLPKGAAGVAGLSRLPLSLPSQAASVLKVAKRFVLCLPTSGVRSGAAIFGGGPFQLLAAPPVDVADGFLKDPHPLRFLKNPKNGAYYIGVIGIVVNNERLPLPPGIFDLHARSGTGGVMLSTVTPYTTLRSDIYRPLLRAFDAATSGIPRAAPVKPFEMCYQVSALSWTRLGFAVANIEMLLDRGGSWLLPGNGSLVQVNDQTVCFAFLEMGVVPGSPAVIFGGFQMEDHLLMFDLEKEAFGFCGPLPGIRTNCGNFDFSMGSS
ncbi:Basic 7S globulin 2 [Dichanthelium oligosanthes]|uniref:Basic 7S globulin 2 n=1 Tax=Dichanthelium oligosanthes TaxID=888268 RepID=A0A1E5V7Z0_9POAL|nr:Basic 7S globulin 2 [Dichanthelium oligosanthes]